MIHKALHEKTSDTKTSVQDDSCDQSATAKTYIQMWHEVSGPFSYKEIFKIVHKVLMGRPAILNLKDIIVGL
jgi:hypothetical protein